MIRLLRDADFWIGVACHPEVRPALLGLDPEVLRDIVAREEVTPLAAEHGGYLLSRADAFGATLELHSLFRPEGWGREALSAAKETAELAFDGGAQLIFTFEMAVLPRSRPPLSFGFRRLGPCANELGAATYWFLTRQAWQASPVFRRQGNINGIRPD